MKIYTRFLVLIFLASCAGLPETPCECNDKMREMERQAKTADSTLGLFLPANKSNYRQNIDELLSHIAEFQKMFLHCAKVYNKQGFCERIKGGSLWDYGVTVPDSAVYMNRYTGSWKKDSLRNAERKKQRELFQLYMKRDVYNETLTKAERASLDSFMRQAAKMPRDTTGRKLFPRMWGNPKDTNLYKYLERVNN